MRARVTSVFSTLAAFAIVGTVLWAVIAGVRDNPGVVGSFATAAAAVIVVVYQRDRESKRETAQLHREQLAPLYEDLFKRFAAGVDFERPKDREFVFQLQRKLIFYGSTPVVRAWLTWLRGIPDDVAQQDRNDPTHLLKWEQFLFAVRRDLGHNNEGLNAGDLLRIYIADFDEYHAAWLTRQAEET